MAKMRMLCSVRETARQDLGDEITPASHAGLIEDRLQMILDCVRGQVPFCADRLGGYDTPHEQRYLGLPLRQAQGMEAWRCIAAWVGRLNDHCDVVIYRAVQMSRVNQ
jgi:hypothetical protein